MGKLWDAMRRAEQESGAQYVSDYNDNLQEPPERYAGDLELNIAPSMAEEYRKLLTTIRSTGQDEGREIKLLMLTAASSGEGVSTVAVTLACSLASDMRDSKVLLMDLNMRRPAIHNFFGISPMPGIVEVVSNYEKRMRLFRASPVRNLQNLHIMTAGNVNSVAYNPLQVIEHEHFKSFLKEIRTFYKLVIIDVPATNQFFDSASIAPFVDATLLVVEADATRTEVIAHARDRLEFANAKLLGIILNKRKMVIPKSIYKRI